MRHIVHALVIVAIGLAAYANSLDASFQFDDAANITENPDLRHPPGLAEVAAFWRAQPSGFYQTRPVGYLTFALELGWHGGAPRAFHATNVAIHLACALLVYALALTTLRIARRGGPPGRFDELGAALAGLLFVAHPLQTEAVTYVVQRLAALATLFYVAALWLYALARSRARRDARALALYASALAAGFLAMRTKEIALTLPLAVAAYELVFFEGTWRERARWLGPMLALAVVIPVARLAGERGARPLGEALSAAASMDSTLPRGAYLATELRVIATYVRLLVLPVRQVLIYDFPTYRTLFAAPVLLSLALVSSLLGAAVALVRRRGAEAAASRVAGYGILLFFTGLLVESSVIPIADVIFEHRVYLPSAGAFLACGAALAFVAERVALKWPSAARWAVAVPFAAVLALALATHARNEVWRDDVSLWSDVVQKSPGASIGHLNLGTALKDHGDLAGAEREWARALELDPANSFSANQLGVLHGLRGELEAARGYYERAIASSRGVNAEPYYNLGDLLDVEGRPGDAVPYFREFIRIARQPYLAEAVQDAKRRLAERGAPMEP